MERNMNRLNLQLNGNLNTDPPVDNGGDETEDDLKELKIEESGQV